MARCKINRTAEIARLADLLPQCDLPEPRSPGAARFDYFRARLRAVLRENGIQVDQDGVLWDEEERRFYFSEQYSPGWMKINPDAKVGTSVVRCFMQYQYTIEPSCDLLAEIKRCKEEHDVFIGLANDVWRGRLTRVPVTLED